MFQDVYCLTVKSYQLLLLEKEKKFASALRCFCRSYFVLNGVCRKDLMPFRILICRVVT